MAKNKISTFFGKVQELISVEPSEEIALDIIIEAIDKRLGSTVSNDIKKVQIIRELIEHHFGLSSTQLDYCFKSKNRDVTIPKLIWVVMAIKIFNDDRPKIKKIIGNGLTHQKIYSYSKIYEDLNDKFPRDRETIQHILSIKELYEKTILLRKAEPRS